MKHIKYFREAISGTEIPELTKGSYFGPAYGDTKSPNTINRNDTEIVFADSKFWTKDEYNSLYAEYLKIKGMLDKVDNIETEFSKEGIESMLAALNP